MIIVMVFCILHAYIIDFGFIHTALIQTYTPVVVISKLATIPVLLRK